MTTPRRPATDGGAHPLTFRHGAGPGDRDLVRAIVESAGFFSAEEADVAVELVDEWLAKGAAGGYEFVFAEIDAETAGYACFGRIPLTQSSFDLYWVAVRGGRQRRGVGRALLEEVERLVAESGGGRVYADTSGRRQYAPTRAFYRAMGYTQVARMPDFFAPGDDKVIFAKPVISTASAAMRGSGCNAPGTG